MKLFFREYGQGQPLVILHGLLGMSDHWIPLAKQFAEQFHVVVPDLRNHGQSPHAEKFSYKHMQADIEELLSDLQIKSCNLIGHSMGGKLAMHLALNHSEMVDKLIVADISPIDYPIDEDNEMVQAINRMNLSSVNNREELRQMIQWATNDPMLQGLILKNISSKGLSGFSWKPDLENITKNLQEIYDFRCHEFQIRASESIDKASFNKETLFLKGDNSQYISENHYPKIAALFPQNKITTIENAGHWLHAEKPAEFYEVCMNFLL
ncbi:MAG TPA: alpha/beta fold hydrolase [Bacteroidales bacterium]|nr:alpha/beta fold hydrolase [Bacteroidales bacterium]